MTHRDHLQHGFVGSDQDFVPGGVFYTRLGECERVPRTPIEEAMEAARLISKEAGDDLRLCLSGGLDSECMAEAFLRAKIPFRALIMRFSDGLNDFDIRHAFEFCAKNDVPFEIFDLDIVDFYQSGRHIEYAKRYRCVSPQLATHLHLMKETRGFHVMSWNPIAIYSDRSNPLLFGLPNDRYFAYERFLKSEGKGGAPFFFLHTPELAYSFLRLPLSQRLLTAAEKGELRPWSYTYRLKCDTYSDGGFRSEPKADKYTGFEKVRRFYAQAFKEEMTAFDDRFRRPLEELYPRESKALQLLSRKFLKPEEDESWRISRSSK